MISYSVNEMQTQQLYTLNIENNILKSEIEKISNEVLIKNKKAVIIIDRRCNEYAVVFQGEELSVFP